jgi:hypothetical protein
MILVPGDRAIDGTLHVAAVLVPERLARPRPPRLLDHPTYRRRRSSLALPLSATAPAVVMVEVWSSEMVGGVLSILPEPRV